MDRTTATTQWKAANPQPIQIFDGTTTRDATQDEYDQMASTGADLILMNQPTPRATQIKAFYNQCKDGTATLAQMRTAWVQLIEYLYQKEISQ